MVKTPQFVEQPFGKRKYWKKLIKSDVLQLTKCETRNLKIIFAKKKLQVDIPVNWTVNKLKFMINIHFEMLDFDKFEFQCNKLLIPGDTRVANLPNDQLIVTKAQCPKSFEKYYKQTMQDVFNKFGVNTESTIYPITHRSFSGAMKYVVPKQRMKNLQQIPRNDNLGRADQQQGMAVLNFLRIIGLLIMGNLILTAASYWQIGILIFIGCIYYLIDQYVRGNQRGRRQAQRQARRRQQFNRRHQQQRNRRQAQNRQQNQPQNNQDNQNKQEIKKQKQQGQNEEEQILERKNQIQCNQQGQGQEIEVKKIEKPKRQVLKAKLKLWKALILQFIYCYILSIFPNWTVQIHLHANQQKMDRIMDEIKNLDPQASEQIKKWQIKQKKQEKNQIIQQQKPKNQ